MLREPVRTCVGCRKVLPATLLVRIVHAPDSHTLRIDRAGAGRGAWLCRSGPLDALPAPECLERAAQRRAFSRAFRVTVDATALISLREKLEERARIDSGGAATATSQRRD
jgi:predicted RNA-binding protein YlxR (DUF448 family)